MNDKDELHDIPPMVPDRDDVDSHISNRASQKDEIVRPSYYTQKIKVSTWPVRIMLTLLTITTAGAAYGAYYMYGVYQYDLRQANLRIGDLELRLALAGEAGEASDSDLMQNIEKTIEQYDLLWANWRANNRTFEDIQSEIAKLNLTNNGQNELVEANSQQISITNQSLMNSDTRLNALGTNFEQLTQSVTGMNASMADLDTMRFDLGAIRESLNSGDSTVLGLVGRLEFMEESMESVNAHRLQVNESLFRMQESIETLQRSQNTSSGSL